MKQKSLSQLVVHFAGDSGDGIQVTGNQFAQSCALFGNDVRTLPDFPAEIRAPAGTLAGVSGFQLHFADTEVHTAGDRFDVLVVFNPAAYHKTIEGLKPGGLLLLDEAKFTPKECQKLGLDANSITTNPNFRVISLPITALTIEALKDSGLTRSGARKCKNLFVLGVICWLTHRSLESIKSWIKQKFAKNQSLIEANTIALRTGYDYAVTVELFTEQYQVARAPKAAGRYRQITGNEAISLGALTASYLAQKPLFMAGYPITPASDILHSLANMGSKGVTTFQAEDEMAAVGAAIGASFAGTLALTATSGPGMDLKSEGIGLAVMAELPLVVVNVQRAGPSTGMPTKVEQSDLLAAISSRHGECPLPVLAPASPGDCFDIMVKAFEIAVEFMTPVIVLSDAYLANSMQAWRVPDLPSLRLYRTPDHACDEAFNAYARNEQLVRPWVAPGTPGKMHRIGGLEKNALGHISYEPRNHETMVNLRAQKVFRAVQSIHVELEGEQSGDCLVIGWGSTYGALRSVKEALQDKYRIGLIQLRVLHPLPEILGAMMTKFKKIIVVELNHGQLCGLLRSHFLVDAKSVTQIQGKPFDISTLKSQIESLLEQEQWSKIPANV